MVAQKRLLGYYRNRGRIVPIILQDLRTDKDLQVVYGARAINAYLPKFLRGQTRDYDIYAKNPRSEARELERKLDKRFGGNYFVVERAKHKGTYRVVSRVEGEVVADYTKPESRLQYRRLGGVRYVQPTMIKQGLRRTLRDPESEYRHAKDKERLQRLLLWEKLRGRNL